MNSNYDINVAVWKCVEKNENKDVRNLANAIEFFNLDDSSISSLKKSVAGKHQENYQDKETFLVENKFLDLSWQVVFEDSSSECHNISSIKILVKVKYLNMVKLQVRELNLILDEKQFEEFYEEIKKISKNI